MANVKVILNSSGVRSLLQSSEMKKELEKQAKRMAGRAGQDCEVYVAPTRAVAEVRTGSGSNNKLLKAMGGSE